MKINVSQKDIDKELEDITEDIRELRDADFHVCPHAEWQSKGEPEKDENGEIIGKYDVECSCNKFDEAINKIERLKEVR